MTEDDALRVWLTREPITTPVESLKISVKWRELDSLYASYSDRDSPNYLTTDTEREAARQQLLEQNPEYAEDRQRRDAYNIGFPTELMEDYVEWYITDWAALNQGHLTPNWEDEWFLMEHPEFYEEMIKFDTLKPRDFSKVPTRKVASLYDKYLHLETGNPRLECRCKNADLDAWLVSAQGYTPAFGTDRCARFAAVIVGGA